jgi:hypothetical protein
MRLSQREPAQATIELVMLLPGLLLGLFLAVALGLVARADAEVAGVAVEAARASVLVSEAAQVQAAAIDRAQAVATAYGLDLGRLQVDADPSEFHRGGQVLVEVHYDLPLAALPLIGWGTIGLHHQAAEPVDRYRSLR